MVVAEDEVLVELSDWGRLASFDMAIEQAGGSVIGGLPTRRCVRVSMPGIVSEEKQQLRLVRALGGVESVEWNARGGGGQLSPDDTYFAQQWHLQNTGQSGATPGADIEVVPAWNIQVGDPSVVVAVLDTGLDTAHPEFSGRTAPGWDFVNEDSDPSADHAHGVYVAALLGAKTDNFFGVAGVDPNCTIVPLKVLDSQNQGTLFDLLQALDWCELNGVDVVNMSLIDYPQSAMLESALQSVRNAGSVLVACAGNGGVGDADASWPGASPETISIGFTDRNDWRHSDSGTGSALDLVAPGASLYTASNSYINTFSQFTGCSAATPLASGVASLLLAEYPDLSHDDVLNFLLQGAEDGVGAPAEDGSGRDDYYGMGRLNAMGALSALCSCDGSESLRGSPPTASVGSGGGQILRVDAGAANAGLLYWLFGNYTGTTPGLNLAGLHLPLNWDGYMQFTLVHPNSPPLTNGFGYLDSNGQAQARLDILAGSPASMIGITLNHAYLVFDGPNFVFASNAASLTLE